MIKCHYYYFFHRILYPIAKRSDMSLSIKNAKIAKVEQLGIM